MRAYLLTTMLLLLAGAAQSAGIERFTPSGAHKDVRQVQARFSGAMAPLGRSDSAAPFKIDCSKLGKGYWADERTWVYDLPQGLRGGDLCRLIGATANSGCQ